MLISLPLSVLLIVVSYVLIIVLFTKLWKKEPITGTLVGMFLGAAVVFLMIMVRQHVYVVHGISNYTHYVSYGSSSYTSFNGEKTKLSGAVSDAIVINDSDDQLLLEEVVYGMGSFPKTIEIAPRSTHSVGVDYIDFFFKETPPSDEVSGKYSDVVVKLWLKAAKK